MLVITRLQSRRCLAQLDATSLEVMIDYLGLLERNINPEIPGNPGIFPENLEFPGFGKRSVIDILSPMPAATWLTGES